MPLPAKRQIDFSVDHSRCNGGYVASDLTVAAVADCGVQR